MKNTDVSYERMIQSLYTDNYKVHTKIESQLPYIDFETTCICSDVIPCDLSIHHCHLIHCALGCQKSRLCLYWHLLGSTVLRTLDCSVQGRKRITDKNPRQKWRIINYRRRPSFPCNTDVTSDVNIFHN